MWGPMWAYGAVDLFRLLCLLLYTTLPTVRTQAQCTNGQSYIGTWEGVQLAWYYSCDSWYYICEGSGWGDEEATVVCREQGYSHGISGSIPWPGSYYGLVNVECDGNESKLQECVADLSAEICLRIGVITQCYLPQIISPNSLTVTEGDSAHFCVSLNGNLREIVHVLIETRDENAIANYDYIPVNYTLTFGPSLQSEQCHDIQIINDSLAEGMEMFTVQLTTNSSAIELTTPGIMINIESNDAQAGDCEDGSLTVVSGVNESSLQLVEMCSEGVWSPVCDHNWTVADATVVCRELGMAQDEVVVEVLPSQGLSHKAYSIDCEGSEATLADCFVQQETVTTCYYALVHCGAAANSQAGRSSAGIVVGIVVPVLVAVLAVVVVLAVLGVIWWKANIKQRDSSAVTMDPNHYEFAEGYTRPVGSQQHSSPQQRREDSVEDFELVNPVYGMGIDQPEDPARVGTPEHNLLNPLYAPTKKPSSQGRAEPVAGQEYTTLEVPHSPSGGNNKVNGYDTYENEDGLPTHIHVNGEMATGDKQ